MPLFPSLLVSSTSCRSWTTDSSKSRRRWGRAVVGRWLMSVVAAVFLVTSEGQTTEEGPCLGCLLFNERHRWELEQGKKQSQERCHYPCQCPDQLVCPEGVGVVKDGCGCCFMCSRQLGDQCSSKDVCDTTKGLSCHYREQGATVGVCRGKHKNPCHVGDVTYMDGEKFQPHCWQLCTCQNGFYGCVHLCPQELHRPSEMTCMQPQLIQVPNSCCREWSCQKMEAAGPSRLAQNGLESHNLRLEHSQLSQTPLMQQSTSLATPAFQSCYKKTTDWTPCSVTCDVGVSIRMVVDTVTCNNFQELRLCYTRPCKMAGSLSRGQGQCKPTARADSPVHIRYQDCLSVREYKLKFCSSCSNKRCCRPRRTRTRAMHFQCSAGKREVFNFMWIKKCRCDSTCEPRTRSSRPRLTQEGRKSHKTKTNRKNAGNRGNKQNKKSKKT